MDFRKLITKMREIDPTTPGQDLEHFTTLAESTGIALGAKEVVTEAAKPDYIDIDGDGDKKEPMKKAAKDAKKDKKSDKKEEVKEAEQIIKAEKKAKMPSKKSILMMCSKGMSVKEMCEAHPDCDQKKLKEMCEACMEEYKKKNESVSFVDMDGEIVEAKSAAQKKAQEKFKNMVKGKKSDDKEMDESKGEKTKYSKKDLEKQKEKLSSKTKELEGKKKTVKESVETKMSFVDMYKMVKESGGQQAIDPMDDVLWTWANRVAVSKVEETNKQEIFAAMLYERNGGRFEMYDVVEKGLTEGKDCNCGPECACKGNCEPNCNCGPEC
jgi:hypothetical protein